MPEDSGDHRFYASFVVAGATLTFENVPLHAIIAILNMSTGLATSAHLSFKAGQSGQNVFVGPTADYTIRYPNETTMEITCNSAAVLAIRYIVLYK